jgi:hypothetical protein
MTGARCRGRHRVTFAGQACAGTVAGRARKGETPRKSGMLIVGSGKGVASGMIEGSRGHNTAGALRARGRLGRRPRTIRHAGALFLAAAELRGAVSVQGGRRTVHFDGQLNRLTLKRSAGSTVMPGELLTRVIWDGAKPGRSRRPSRAIMSGSACLGGEGITSRKSMMRRREPFTGLS